MNVKVWLFFVARLWVVFMFFCGLPSSQGQRSVDQNSAEFYYTFPKETNYKFIAAVKSKAGVCTASIINQEWVLTAAHCFYFRKKKISDEAAKIMAGVTNFEYPNPRKKQETTSDKIVVHPRFKYDKPSKFDVALVKLKDPFEFNEDVGNIQVSGEEWPQTVNETQNCISLGFGGYMSTAPPSGDLKVWNVTAMHGEKACPCAMRFQAKRLVCHSEHSIPLMCKVDDGGPMVCADGKVRAVAHMIWNRATCEDIQYPLPKCTGGPDKTLSLYFFLCPVNDWLHSVVSDIPPKPVSCRASHFANDYDSSHSPILLISFNFIVLLL